MIPHVCRCGTCFREMNGAVAQLGERLSGRQEVRGSTPRSSTSFEGEIATLVEGLRKRAEIRAKIDRGHGKVDRLGVQLTEAAEVIERLWRASSRVVAIAKDGEPDHEHADLVLIWKILETALGENDREFREEQAAWQRASAEAFWRIEEELEGAKVSDEMTEDGSTGRALELADMVSDMIWGGERGWERATNEQFKYLLQQARTKLRQDA